LTDKPATTTDPATGSPSPRSRKRRSSAGRRAGEQRQSTPRERASIQHCGGRYAPLDQDSLIQIHEAALELLATIGMSGAPEHVRQMVLKHGGLELSNGRLGFPQTLVNRAIDNLPRDITLYGQISGHKLKLTGQRVHAGTGGAAPMIIDTTSGRYRSSTLNDLYDAARLVDTLPNIQFFSRSMVATDIPNLRDMDINTAYASLSLRRFGKGCAIGYTCSCQYVWTTWCIKPGHDCWLCSTNHC